MPWFFDLKEQLEEKIETILISILPIIVLPIASKKAKDKGASAIILYNTSFY